jgi:hypothetical protein
MGKINVGRLILGGIVAGIVNDILGYGVDGWLLAQGWANAMKALGHGQSSLNTFILLNLVGIVAGFVALWIYVAIRPRFGPGVKTAIYAGVASWVLGALLPDASFMYATGLFPRHLTLYTTIGALVEISVATIIGAALYKEA